MTATYPDDDPPPLGGQDTPQSATPPEIRSPSPKRNLNILGLGLPESHSTPQTQSSAPSTASVLGSHPHLGHYIFNLLATASSSPPRGNGSALGSGQHPLSVSSSGESDDEDDSGQRVDGDAVDRTPQKNRSATTNRFSVAIGDKEDLVQRIVDLLDNEEEEKVKELLKPYLGELAKDEILMDQVCLDCMHRRRDDIEHVPYAPHLTPARARPSPAVKAPIRPYTPSRMPSFRAQTPLGRPQSPSFPSTASGAQTPTLQRTLSGLARDAISSPPISAKQAQSSSDSGADSPSTSPRMLNAKASAFNPSPRPASGSLTASAAVFSPSDLWKDVPVEPPRSASPFGNIGPPGMVRTASSLAMATPLFSDRNSPFHSPMGTPNKKPIAMPDVFASPITTSVPQMSKRSLVPDDDDDDAFSPFGSGLPRLQHQDQSLNSDARPFQPGNSDGGLFVSSVSHSESSHSYGSRESGESNEYDEVDMGASMTPIDVLSSVFSTVPKVELEDALHRAGYDFEGAMAILVSQHTQPRSGSSTPQRIGSPRPLLGVAGRSNLPSSQYAPREGYFQQGGRSFSGNMSPGYGARSPGGGGGLRMCRYFLAGECRRSDCRFSHDLDRALCRFWLRGHCAKGPNCEFMHHFPNNVDPMALSNAMARVELSSDGSAQGRSSPGPYGNPPDEFPDLLATRLGRASRFDPSRNRFANALKRAPPGQIAMPTLQITGAKFSQAATQPYSPSAETRPAVTVPIPKASQRLKLRQPLLLPTLRTGTSANDQYMNTRATAIRLGHARNACLARASDAFRRGDGAAAKRFSREGRSLNERMLSETLEAAQTLVKERRKEAQAAVRERDPNWSNDPSDRSQRGKDCGGGLGVVMGVASSRSVPGGDILSVEERTEVLLDLHTLHGPEGAEILSQFLQELDRENFRGLAFVVVGDEKHVGTQDAGRGASKVRLGTSVKIWLTEYGYAWNEAGGVICVDPARYW